MENRLRLAAGVLVLWSIAAGCGRKAGGKRETGTAGGAGRQCPPTRRSGTAEFWAGVHFIDAVARDEAGNTATSAPFG